MAADCESVAADCESVAADCEFVTADCEFVAADCEAVAADCESVAADCESVAADCESVAADCESVTADCESVAADCESVTADCESVAADCESVAADCESVAADCESVAADCEYVAADCESVTPRIVIAIPALRPFKARRRLLSSAVAVSSAVSANERYRSGFCNKQKLLLQLLGSPPPSAPDHEEVRTRVPKINCKFSVASRVRIFSRSCAVAVSSAVSANKLYKSSFCNKQMQQAEACCRSYFYSFLGPHINS